MHAFPNERVVLKPDERPASAATSTADPGDEHVCALAISGRADMLITPDRGYVTEALKAHGIAVRTPDEFLTGAFQDHQRDSPGPGRAGSCLGGAGGH